MYFTCIHVYTREIHVYTREIHVYTREIHMLYTWEWSSCVCHPQKPLFWPLTYLWSFRNIPLIDLEKWPLPQKNKTKKSHVRILTSFGASDLGTHDDEQIPKLSLEVQFDQEFTEKTWKTSCCKLTHADCTYMEHVSLTTYFQLYCARGLICITYISECQK